MFQRQLLRSSRAASQAIKQTPTKHIQLSPYSSLTSRSLRISQPTASQYFSRRWQSTENQAPSDKAAEGGEKPAEASPEDTLKQEIEKKNKEITDLKDKYLRSVADYRNLQDRTAREATAARQFAIQRFATDLLDSIDNLDRALSSVPDAAVGKSSSDANKAAASESAASTPNQDLLNLYNGLKMSDGIMMQTLKKHGLERFDPLEREGRKFDPNLDEATFFTKVEGKNDGEVFYTQSKGYTLNGRVIRASKVGVVKNS